MNSYENIAEIVNMDQFQELFYTRNQRYIAYGLVWYFIREHNFIYISDYSFQDLLEIEDTHKGFIKDWIEHAIIRIRELKTSEYSSSEYFIKLVKRITKNIPGSMYVEGVSEAIFEMFLKVIRKSRVSHKLDVYSAAGRVLRNYFISHRLDFNKNNANRAYDYGEFLYEGGLIKIFEWIRVNRGICLVKVDWSEVDPETGSVIGRVPRSLERVLEVLDQKNIYKQLKSAIMKRDLKANPEPFVKAIDVPE